MESDKWFGTHLREAWEIIMDKGCHHTCECKHDDLKLCKKCDVVYCVECKEEWPKYRQSYPYWYAGTTFTSPLGTFTTGGDTGSDTTTITIGNSTCDAHG